LEVVQQTALRCSAWCSVQMLITAWPLLHHCTTPHACLLMPCFCWSCSNITLLAWVIFYWVLYFKLRGRKWDYDDWDVLGRLAHNKLNEISQWAASYR